MNSLSNLELTLTYLMGKYGSEETVNQLHTMLLGYVYDFEPVSQEFLDDLTALLVKINNRLLENKYD